MDKSHNEVVEYRGHQPLESRGGIAVPLLHYPAHECAEYSSEGCLWDILVVYVYLLVCFRHVQFGPVCSMRNVMLYSVLVRKGLMSFSIFLFCICRLNTVCSFPFFLRTHNMGTACLMVTGTHQPALVYRLIFSASSSFSASGHFGKR